MRGADVWPRLGTNIFCDEGARIPTRYSSISPRWCESDSLQSSIDRICQLMNCILKSLQSTFDVVYYWQVSRSEIIRSSFEHRYFDAINLTPDWMLELELTERSSICLASIHSHGATVCSYCILGVPANTFNFLEISAERNLIRGCGILELFFVGKRHKVYGHIFVVAFVYFFAGQ